MINNIEIANPIAETIIPAKAIPLLESLLQAMIPKIKPGMAVNGPKVQQRKDAMPRTNEAIPIPLEGLSGFGTY